MMRLSTLWTVDRTLDAADRRSPLADRLVERWEHDPETLRFVRSSANFVYRFRADGAERYLRFADDSERTREMVEEEVDLLEWLVASGVAVARPVRSRSGNLVETVDTSFGTFHAVVFEVLMGSHLKTADLDPPGFFDWGAALGRLHDHVVDYADPALTTRPSWRDQFALARTYVPADNPGIRRELDAVAAGLAGLPMDGGRCGLIHGDFELDNLRWPEPAEGVPGILDFDDCSRHWFAADIAFALRDLFDHGADLSHPSVDAFVRGYQSQFPLDDTLFAALPLFSRLSRLLVYSKLVRALDLPDRPDQPDWLRRLRGKLEAHTATYAASLSG